VSKNPGLDRLISKNREAVKPAISQSAISNQQSQVSNRQSAICNP